MNYSNKFFYYPGGEDEPTPSTPLTRAEETELTDETPVASPTTDTDDVPVVEKIKEALQDWANKDQADLDFDDTRP